MIRLLLSCGPPLTAPKSGLCTRGLLSNDTVLTDHFTPVAGAVDLVSVLREIDDARVEDATRKLRMVMRAILGGHGVHQRKPVAYGFCGCTTN